MIRLTTAALLLFTLPLFAGESVKVMKAASKGVSASSPKNVTASTAGLLLDLRLSALKVFKTNTPDQTKNFFVNDNISIRAEVENNGDTESIKTVVRIKIVNNLNVSNPWALPGPVYEVKIPALNPKTRTDAIASHTFTDSGTFWAMAMIDPENKIAEKDESNNSSPGMDAMIDIKKTFVDLSPGINMAQAKAFILRDTDFDVMVSNNGTIPSTACRMRVEFTPDDKKYVDVPVIAPNQAFVARVKHRYPVAGHKTVRAVVDPDRKNARESNWDNNKSQIRINVHLN